MSSQVYEEFKWVVARYEERQGMLDEGVIDWLRWNGWNSYTQELSAIVCFVEFN